MPSRFLGNERTWGFLSLDVLEVLQSAARFGTEEPVGVLAAPALRELELADRAAQRRAGMLLVAGCGGLAALRTKRPHNTVHLLLRDLVDRATLECLVDAGTVDRTPLLELRLVGFPLDLDAVRLQAELLSGSPRRPALPPVLEVVVLGELGCGALNVLAEPSGLRLEPLDGVAVFAEVLHPQAYGFAAPRVEHAATLAFVRLL